MGVCRGEKRHLPTHLEIAIKDKIFLENPKSAAKFRSIELKILQ